MALPDLGAGLLGFIDAQTTSPLSSLVAGTNLFLAQYPQQVIEGVVVIESGGERSARSHRYVVRTVQITSRYRDYAAATAMARALYDLLDMPATTRTMGGAQVIYSKAMQPPFSLGQDERQAWRVVFNVELHVVI